MNTEELTMKYKAIQIFAAGVFSAWAVDDIALGDYYVASLFTGCAVLLIGLAFISIKVRLERD